MQRCGELLQMCCCEGRIKSLMAGTRVIHRSVEFLLHMAGHIAAPQQPLPCGGEGQRQLSGWSLPDALCTCVVCNNN